MKNIVNILFSIVALFGVFACEGHIEQPNGEIQIDLPKDGYIFFDSQVATRGTLVENTMPYDFGVVGYMYSGTNWTGYRAKAKPNVFSSGNQLVEWNDETLSHNYTPLVPWEEGQTYTFFAYYPWGLDFSNKGAGLPSGKDYEGTPFVTYTVHHTNSENHKDVMTAQVINTDPSVRSVSLHMVHRLSAVSAYARSYVNKGVFDALKNTDKEVYVKINSVNITFDGIVYDKAEIPLDEDERIKSSLVNTSSFSYDFTYTDPLRFFDSADKQVDITGGGKAMIFIPQDIQKNDNDEDVPIICKVTVEYDLIDAGNNTIWDTVYPEGTPNPPSKIQTRQIELEKLDPKVHYYLILNFTKTGLTVDATKVVAWDDKPVEYEFE